MKSKFVTLNSKVTIKSDKTERVFMIVSPDSININEEKISTESPLGKALLNRNLNESIEVQTPDSIKKYLITNITT